jgi:glycosyltransferase involved in cell wall biosynthesis
VRIAVIAAPNAVGVSYRAIPVASLAEHGHDVIADDATNTIRWQLLSQCDVVFVQRFSDEELRRRLVPLQEQGVAIVWDNDDDLTNGPAEAEGSKRNKELSKRAGALRSQQAKAAMLRMIQLADAVTTPSHVLAAQYREWGARHVEVVDNYLPADYLPGSPAPHDGVTIGWVAGVEHRHDLVHLGLRDTLQRLLEAHPELSVTSIGINLGLASERYRHQVAVQYPDLGSHIAQFDVGIAPLHDIPFNRARSSVKVKEYAAAGVPWLASPIGPYAGLGEKQGGRLVADDRWHDELDRLIRDPRARRKLAKRGRKWAETQTATRNRRAWEQALQTAVERRRLATAA